MYEIPADQAMEQRLADHTDFLTHLSPNFSLRNCLLMRQLKVLPTTPPKAGLSAMPAVKRSMSFGWLYRVERICHWSAEISAGGLSHEHARGRPQMRRKWL